MSYITQRFVIVLGYAAAEINWGFRAPKGTYDEIAEPLGVLPISPTDQVPAVFGCNNPRPARVRVAYRDATADARVRSVKRFCDYEKLNDVIFGIANDKQIWVCNNQTGDVRAYPIEGFSLG